MFFEWSAIWSGYRRTFWETKKPMDREQIKGNMKHLDTHSKLAFISNKSLSRIQFVKALSVRECMCVLWRMHIVLRCNLEGPIPLCACVRLCVCVCVPVCVCVSGVKVRVGPHEPSYPCLECVGADQVHVFPCRCCLVMLSCRHVAILSALWKRFRITV